MKLHEDYEEQSEITPIMVMTIVAVSVAVAIILVVVLLLNRERPHTADAFEQTVQSVAASSPVISEDSSDGENQLLSDSLHPEDLDFWDKYPIEENDNEETVETETVQEIAENDPSTDGKHTRIVTSEGKEEWVLISPYLPKHEYDFTKLVCQSDLMKYYEDGKQISFVGIDVSKYQDYIDFVKVRKAGIDFCMIRAGARGYGTGQLIEDEYFGDNLKRATDAGLDVGIYFYSQAITEEEAVEEADFVLERIGEYRITYPIAFDMELINNDSARTDSLTKAERTAITKAFLDTVEARGYKAVIYGNKEWLIKEIDMSKLTSYDVWLAQDEDIPDYPYQFTMWQYDTGGSIDGVSGLVDLNISFVDYSEK